VTRSTEIFPTLLRFVILCVVEGFPGSGKSSFN